MSLIGHRKERGIMIREYTLWKRIEMAVLAYFASKKNKPATYREIARAYVSASYSNYQKACEGLRERGYLEKLDDGKFKVNESSWGQIQKGTETVERALPYFNSYLKKLKKR